MATTPFGNVIEFLGRLGLFDVVLPFLLVFVIIFAILEKTKVFGTEKVGDVDYPKKNINAMVAFVISFFVIASKELVGIINKSLSQLVIVILLVVSYLILIGIFYKEDEEVILEGKWRTFFMVILGFAVLFIFFANIMTKGGQSWLEYGYDYIIGNFDSTVVMSFILFIIIVLVVIYVTKSPAEKKKEEKSS